MLRRCAFISLFLRCVSVSASQHFSGMTVLFTSLCHRMPLSILKHVASEIGSSSCVPRLRGIGVTQWTPAGHIVGAWLGCLSVRLEYRSLRLFLPSLFLCLSVRPSVSPSVSFSVLSVCLRLPVCLSVPVSVWMPSRYHQAYSNTALWGIDLTVSVISDHDREWRYKCDGHFLV